MANPTLTLLLLATVAGAHSHQPIRRPLPVIRLSGGSSKAVQPAAPSPAAVSRAKLLLLIANAGFGSYSVCLRALSLVYQQ